MIYNQADCQLSGEGEVQTAQIAWFWEKHPALNCDSLRWGDRLLGYLVCLATWTWQTDESSLPCGADRLTRGKKWSCRRTRSWVSGEGRARGRRTICLPVALASLSKSKWNWHRIILNMKGVFYIKNNIFPSCCTLIFRGLCFCTRVSYFLFFFLIISPLNFKWFSQHRP